MFTIFWVVPVIFTALKGKVYTAALALLIFPAAYIGALRLAKPRSPWAVSHYQDRPDKMAEAVRRQERVDRLMQPLKDAWAKLVLGFGEPTPELPPAASHTEGAAAPEPITPEKQ